MDISSCLVCGGTGKMRCQFCGGTGQVGPGIPPPQPGSGDKSRDKGKAAAKTDRLAGKWNTQGGYYNFVREGDAYKIEEYGVVGKTGTGSAVLEGDTVRIYLRNVLAGDVTYELNLKGETMSGAITVFGMQVPIFFQRE